MPCIAAYLRRGVAALEWVEATHPEAVVAVGRVGGGTWKDLCPRWRLEGDRIRLEIRQEGRCLAFWISAVQPVPSGLRMPLYGRAASGDAVLVSWADSGAAPDPGRRDPLPAACTWVRHALAGCRILSASRASDRAHSLSGRYARIRARRMGSDCLILACGPDAEEDEAAAILTQALLWRTQLGAAGVCKEPPEVLLLVPEGRSGTLWHRATMVRRDQMKIEIREYAVQASGAWEARMPEPPGEPCEDRDFRWPVTGPFRWSPALERVLNLAPEQIRRYPKFHDYDSLRLLGLEFGRVFGAGRDRISFGLGPAQVELNEDNFAELRALVESILYFRRPDSPSIEHPYYRLQPERWLESLLLDDVARLFPELVPGAVYSQIPVYLGKSPARVDILGVDHEGRLAVMELKADADPEMPLQCLDYWGRVIGHNLRGDFERRKYFGSIRLSRDQPRVYLVAPVLSFHDATERLLGCLDPRLEAVKIGINEDWRCGIRILRRVRGRCGELL